MVFNEVYPPRKQNLNRNVGFYRGLPHSGFLRELFIDTDKRLVIQGYFFLVVLFLDLG